MAEYIHSTKVTLTDAQIKALPSNPVVIVPATEVLDYEGMPTRLFLPIQAQLHLHQVAAYAGVAGQALAYLAWGSDWSTDVAVGASTIADTASQSAEGAVSLFSPLTKVGETLVWFSPALATTELIGTLQDNALVLAVNNPALGDFTGGGASNTGTILVLYVVYDVVADEYVAASPATTEIPAGVPHAVFVGGLNTGRR